MPDEPQSRRPRRAAIIAVVSLLVLAAAFFAFVKGYAPYGFISKFHGRLIPNPTPMGPPKDAHSRMVREELERIYRFYAFEADVVTVKMSMQQEFKGAWFEHDEPESNTIYFSRPSDNAVIGLSPMRPNWNVPPGTTCVAVIYAKPGWLEQKIQSLRKLLGW